MYNFSQGQIFIFFFIIGIIIGLTFDVFKAIRKCFKTPDKVTFIQDLLFIIISTYLIILGIIKLNSGEVRFYLFLGIFLGIIIYFLTISNICVIILYVIVEFCKKILEILKMNIIKINKILNLIVVLAIIYFIFTFINQQVKLNSYNQDISYYSSQIQELEDEKEELVATQSNVNSKEYIEKVAREKLDMYLPNETVYIDINK